MENRENFKKFVDLLSKDADSTRVLRHVFEARRKTSMMDNYAFSMNSLSGDMIYGRDSDDNQLTMQDFAQLIKSRKKGGDDFDSRVKAQLDKKEIKQYKNVKDAKSAVDFVKTLFIESHGEADFQDIFDNGYSLQENDIDQTFMRGANELNEYFAAIESGYLDFDRVNNKLTQGECVYSFLLNSLNYFNQKAEENNLSKVVPFLATAMLGRSLFDPQMNNEEAGRLCDSIENMLDGMVCKVIAGMSGKEKNVAMETVVKQASTLTTKLLWMIDENNNSAEALKLRRKVAAPKLSEIDDKYNIPEKYLHDIALYKELFESTQSVDQRKLSIAQGCNELSYVGYGTGIVGDIVNLFQNSRGNDQKQGAKIDDMTRLLYSIAKDEGAGIVQALTSFDADPNLNLQKLVNSAYAIYYSGTTSEQASQFMEALGNAFGELKMSGISPDKFNSNLKECVKNAVADLHNSRQVIQDTLNEILLNPDYNGPFKVVDVPVLDQIANCLAELPDNAFVAAPAKKVKTPEEKLNSKGNKFKNEVLSLIQTTLADAAYGDGALKITRIKGRNGNYVVNQSAARATLGAFLLEGDAEPTTAEAPETTKTILEEVENLTAPKILNKKAKETAAQAILLETGLLEKAKAKSKNQKTGDEADA